MQITEENKEMAKEEKQYRSQKKASPKNNNDNNQQNVSSVKQVSTPVGKCPLASRESSVTPILKRAPDGKNNTPVYSGTGSLSSGNQLKLKRKRLPSISKEPTIKLSRVDTENLKKAKPNPQKLECATVHDSSINGINSNTTISSSYKRYLFVC